MNQPSHVFDIIEEVYVQEVSKLMTKLMLLLEECRMIQLHQTANFGQRMELHTGTSTAEKSQRRNNGRRVSNNLHSGVQESARKMRRK